MTLGRLGKRAWRTDRYTGTKNFSHIDIVIIQGKCEKKFHNFQWVKKICWGKKLTSLRNCWPSRYAGHQSPSHGTLQAPNTLPSPGSLCLNKNDLSARKFPYPNKAIESLFICRAIIITGPESSQADISLGKLSIRDQLPLGWFMTAKKEKTDLFLIVASERLTSHSRVIESISFHRINLRYPEETRIEPSFSYANPFTFLRSHWPPRPYTATDSSWWD